MRNSGAGQIQEKTQPNLPILEDTTMVYQYSIYLGISLADFLPLLAP